LKMFIFERTFPHHLGMVNSTFFVFLFFCRRWDLEWRIE